MQPILAMFSSSNSYDLMMPVDEITEILVKNGGTNLVFSSMSKNGSCNAQISM